MLQLAGRSSPPSRVPPMRGRPGHRAQGGAWGQLSERARDEPTRPLRVESGRASPPGEDPPRWQPGRRGLRQGGPRLPEPEEVPAEGEGEPKTIERPRVRARFADQAEMARPPEGGWRDDPRPPPSPGESGAGSPEAESTGSGREDETAAGPQPKKARRGGRASRPPYNHREANRRTDRAGGWTQPAPGQGGRAEGL